MKKVFSQFKVSLTALLLVGGLLMLAESAQAQTSTIQPQSTNGVKIPINGTWVSTFEASNLLTQEVAILNGQIDALSGHQQELAKMKLWFLEMVNEAVAAGVPLNKAIQLSFDKVLGEVQLDSGINLFTQAEMDAMFDQVVDLLTN